VDINPLTNSQKKNHYPGELSDIFHWARVRDTSLGEDASDQEITNEDLEQILAQCYRIARERAGKTQNAISASSIQTVSSNLEQHLAP
jgi:hypothetical protein